MPTSDINNIASVVHLAWEIAPERILDIGPGRGKYGLLLREYLEEPVFIDAIEVEPRYVTSRLEAIYDQVTVGSIMDHLPDLDRYDLVLMVDVLEHLTKEEGQAVLDACHAPVIVATPREFFQNPEWESYPSEEHRSLWAVDDFAGRIAAVADSDSSIVVRLRSRRGHGGLRELGDRWEEAAKSDGARAAISTAPADTYDESGRGPAEQLVALVDPARYPNLIEFGCGDGRVTKHLAERYQTVLACDLSPTMLAKVEDRKLRNCVTLLTDGTDPNVPVASYDAAYSDSVLLHNTKDDVREIVRGLRGVVRVGGLFAFQLPCYESFPHEPDTWTDVGVWTPREIRALAYQGGWRPEVVNVNPGYFRWDDIGPVHGALHLFVAE